MLHDNLSTIILISHGIDLFRILSVYNLSTCDLLYALFTISWSLILSCLNTKPRLMCRCQDILEEFPHQGGGVDTLPSIHPGLAGMVARVGQGIQASSRVHLVYSMFCFGLGYKERNLIRLKTELSFPSHMAGSYTSITTNLCAYLYLR